jgi:hypothetical protein
MAANAGRGDEGIIRVRSSTDGRFSDDVDGDKRLFSVQEDSTMDFLPESLLADLVRSDRDRKESGCLAWDADGTSLRCVDARESTSVSGQVFALLVLRVSRQRMSKLRFANVEDLVIDYLRSYEESSVAESKGRVLVRKILFQVVFSNACDLLFSSQVIQLSLIEESRHAVIASGSWYVQNARFGRRSLRLLICQTA